MPSRGSWLGDGEAMARPETFSGGTHSAKRERDARDSPCGPTPSLSAHGRHPGCSRVGSTRIQPIRSWMRGFSRAPAACGGYHRSTASAAPGGPPPRHRRGEDRAPFVQLGCLRGRGGGPGPLRGRPRRAEPGQIVPVAAVDRKGRAAKLGRQTSTGARGTEHLREPFARASSKASSVGRLRTVADRLVVGETIRIEGRLVILGGPASPRTSAPPSGGGSQRRPSRERVSQSALDRREEPQEVTAPSGRAAHPE